MKDIYLSGGVRTPIASFGGAFEQTPAPKLGSAAVRAALARAGVAPDQVDEVIFGNVVSAGLGQNVARQVAIGAGLGPTIGATTVNAAHIIDLRTALSQVYTAAGFTPPTYTDTALGVGTTITAMQIAELRAAVIAIE